MIGACSIGACHRCSCCHVDAGCQLSGRKQFTPAAALQPSFSLLCLFGIHRSALSTERISVGRAKPQLDKAQRHTRPGWVAPTSAPPIQQRGHEQRGTSWLRPMSAACSELTLMRYFTYHILEQPFGTTVTSLKWAMDLRQYPPSNRPVQCSNHVCCVRSVPAPTKLYTSRGT